MSDSKEGEEEDSHNQGQEQSEHSDENRSTFDIDKFLSNFGDVPPETKDLFKYGDLDDYNKQLEEAKAESRRLAKEEKKRRKAEARTKLFHEASSSAVLTITREPLPTPSIPIQAKTNTLVDPLSQEHMQEPGHAVPTTEEQAKEPETRLPANAEEASQVWPQQPEPRKEEQGKDLEPEQEPTPQDK